MIRLKKYSISVVVTVAAVVFCAGCETDLAKILPTKGGEPASTQKVPEPINLLLPKTLEIHPFTQTSTFQDGSSGIHARIQARDAYGDPTKAFGDFRFDLYEFRPQNQGKRGARLEQWNNKLSLPEINLTHWDRHTRSYEFRLSSNHKLKPGSRLIFVATFSSHFTPRITAEREIVVGE